MSDAASHLRDMLAAATPGPWTPSPWHLCGQIGPVHRLDVYGCEVSSPSGKWVCVLTDKVPDGEKPTGADAHLIAATLELAELLAAALDLLQKAPGWKGTDFWWTAETRALLVRAGSVGRTHTGETT